MGVMTPEDMQLVQEFAARQSERAFAEIVSRYTGLVYSAALRQVQSPQLAEEVTQVVFIILARKAASLNSKTILPSWLYRTACFVSSSARKREFRRQRREQEAYMQSTLNESSSEPSWTQLSPLLDEAMLRLGQADRDALVLRFFEGRSLNEVGASLGLGEDAAKKRVARAVEKLRSFFTKRGVAIPAVALTTAISANSVHAAPPALATTITTVAVAKGATVASSTSTLIHGALKVMAFTQAKTAIAVGLGILLAAGTTTYVATSVLHETQDEAIAAIKKLGGDVRLLRNKTPYLVGLNNTPATDADLTHLKALPMIQTLDLNFTKVTGAGFSNLKGMTNLTTFYLFGAAVDDAGLENVKYTPKLLGIYLGETKVTDAGMKHLKQLPNLRILYLNKTAITDAGLQNLSGTTITGLYIADTAVTDAGLTNLPQFKLSNLDLSRTKVTDAGLPQLKYLFNLQFLYLNGTATTDAGLTNLRTLTTLRELQLSDTSITDAGLEQLTSLTSLKDLRLKGTKVTPEGIQKLQRALPNCRINISQ